ncbi:MAG: hypothetical protein A2Z91_05340 [Deltaproteobacteria bacterium GWA2_38_16]|nr:MAG: hypothetical protein A2Z91_05340 [Deltaproteobacteria bacterium GWA2_38_16]OGQ03202.1 MAG: hypothetical protein A3D19_04070 [Deltaproteobacteria bacterium RIFCSPHIGHO2_02_FULL_38_15]OGQ59795.1 MAG: hypothetical protein A3G92_02785 [Deltaproteobacteria bacterium RIFCSPLOWO2_12_FULL_38_8]HBQ20372.1 hypothetical protein [Deltaproteobacteria bacterium]
MGCGVAKSPEITSTLPSLNPEIPLSYTSYMAFPSDCKGLKISGELSTADFTKLFRCLNKKGGLNDIAPMVLDNPSDTELFVSLYNETFGKNPQFRNDTLQLLKNLDDNQGLGDLFKILSLLISEFIDTPNFDETTRELLKSILSDDLNLMPLLKSVITHPESEEFNRLLKNAFHRGTLSDFLTHLGFFLNQPELLVQFINNISALPTPSSNFTWNDLDELNIHHVPRNSLEALYELQKNSKLPTLIQLVTDLVKRNSTSSLTAERLEKLNHSPELLTPEQREASLQVLKSHPANDLVALIKLFSSLNRRFMDDENSTLNRNFLYSLDIFLQGVKSAFDADPHLGVDAEASRVMTIYSLFIDLSYTEIESSDFHSKNLDEKFTLYQNGTLYPKYITDYQTQKTREVLSLYKEQLENEKDPDNPDQPRWTPKEIRQKIRTRETEFKENELPGLTALYQDFLNKEVKKALSFINERPLILTFTLYDVLMNLKESPQTIAVIAAKSLLNLDNDFILPFLDQLIQGPIKDFYEFNRPVDTFLKSLDVEHSGSTWLSHTVDPLVHGFSDGMPIKDQITIISVVESYQALEKLLITENRIHDIKDILLPFMKAINMANQDQRILNMLTLFHSGQFTDGHTESQELATTLSPILISAIDSGFLNSSLELMASFGNDADTINRFLTFITHPNDNSERPILSMINTIKNLAQNHPQALTLCLTHLHHFLTPQNISTLQSFIQKYETASFHLRYSESILTQMIKRGQMEHFLKIVERMLDNQSFRSVSLLLKRVIEKGELEKTLKLLVQLMLVQEGKQ